MNIIKGLQNPSRELRKRLAKAGSALALLGALNAGCANEQVKDIPTEPSVSNSATLEGENKGFLDAWAPKNFDAQINYYLLKCIINDAISPEATFFKDNTSQMINLISNNESMGKEEIQEFINLLQNPQSDNDDYNEALRRSILRLCSKDCNKEYAECLENLLNAVTPTDKASTDEVRTNVLQGKVDTSILENYGLVLSHRTYMEKTISVEEYYSLPKNNDDRGEQYKHNYHQEEDGKIIIGRLCLTTQEISLAIKHGFQHTKTMLSIDSVNLFSEYDVAAIKKDVVDGVDTSIDISLYVSCIYNNFKAMLLQNGLYKIQNQNQRKTK